MGLGLPGARVSAAAVAAAPTSGAVRLALGSVAAAAAAVGWGPGLSCTYRWLKKPETRSITWEI